MKKLFATLLLVSFAAFAQDKNDAMEKAEDIKGTLATPTEEQQKHVDEAGKAAANKKKAGKKAAKEHKGKKKKKKS